MTRAIFWRLILLILGCWSIYAVGAAEDEADRPGKRRTTFRCASGQLVERDAACDLNVDCDDGSDETRLVCETRESRCGEYSQRCDYGACLDHERFCDGVIDCVDNSDENTYICPNSVPSTTMRTASKVQNSNSTTISPTDLKPIPNTASSFSTTNYTVDPIFRNTVINTGLPWPSKYTEKSRNEYRFLPELKAYYKLHEERRTYLDALAACDRENADLFHSKSLAESNAVIRLFNESDIGRIWLGVRDVSLDGRYVTMDGAPISYSDWESDEDAYRTERAEECAVLKFSNAKFKDVNCGATEYFVCRRTTTPSLRDPCRTSDTAYVYNAESESCYKIHTQPKTWREAFLICKGEKSRLAIMNGDREVAYLVERMTEYTLQKYPGSYYYNNFFIGLSDLTIPGTFLNVDGNTLDESGYAKWAKGQPDNRNNMEHCGALLRNGLLNDLDCDGLAMFICEKSVVPDEIIDVRF